MQPVLAVLVLSELCLAIRVPIQWDEASASEVTNQPLRETSETSIPNQYFGYTAQKPQFAIDVAAFHGVQSPENHYKAYPVSPYTGLEKLEYGKHKIFDENKNTFEPLQRYVKKNEGSNNEGITGIDYEVFHPYKAEEPALQKIYKDPVLTKIRNDIQNSQYRLQKYENDAGTPNIADDEYLETPEQIDRKKNPYTNIPAPYEIHRPMRKPAYYKPVPLYNNREELLNHRFRHPWNQHIAKIRPMHYRPLRNHLGRLRQHHALTFDDDKNEYPQLSRPHDYSEPVDGYDIYQRGKDKFNQLRNNIDESINQSVNENRPAIYQKLELQNNGEGTSIESNKDDDEEEFVPVKSYAQVRKTESTKHLPRQAAFTDAESYDEFQNAPRLKEAIKSTKAQTVYTEEGYEDAAYDHAGEQKHAEENEGHAGYLREKEISRGKFKTPTESAKYQDGTGSIYKDQTLHGKQWNSDNINKEEDSESEDYADEDHSIEADIYKDVTGRNKRENKIKPLYRKPALKIKEKSSENDDEEEKSSESPNDEDENDEAEDETEKTTTKKKKKKYKSKTKMKKNVKQDKSSEDDSSSSEEASSESPGHDDDDDSKETKRSKRGNHMTNESQHEVIKRESNFKVPEININSTFLSSDEIEDNSNLREGPQKEDIKEKYPYYFKNLKSIHRLSPLRYAENFKLIPMKSKGGTEFYDSRSQLECPEVDDKVDALPEKLKKEGHPDSNESGDDEETSKRKSHANFDNLKENPRLKGLGDKIDCFKAKFFGENPLDSPFFKEDLILDPEPITVPTLDIYQLLHKKLASPKSVSDIFKISKKLEDKKGEVSNASISNETDLKKAASNKSLIDVKVQKRSDFLNDSPSDIGDIINKSILQENIAERLLTPKSLLQSNKTVENISYHSFRNMQDVTQLPRNVRKKRASPFSYEPYKIITDSQVPESKKTTTTHNFSPLIKQLQSSKVVDTVVRTTQDKEQPVNRNIFARTYKDIGRKEREKGSEDSTEISFIDVNLDKRRGEPRYELRYFNHKPKYTPVENKKAMTFEDYEAHTNKTDSITESNNRNVTLSKQNLTKPKISGRIQTPAVKSYYDVAHFLPKPYDVQKSSASNKISRVAKPNILEKAKTQEKENIDDDYEEYGEVDEEEHTTTTTTTIKPSFKRRKMKPTTSTTTVAPEVEDEIESELPKLRLITRFRNIPNKKMKEIVSTERPIVKNYRDDDVTEPKYREKKKKTSKSTLVTDTESYGEDGDGDKEDDMRMKEVDSLIGVKQDMDEYVPLYEKKVVKTNAPMRSSHSSRSEEEDYEDSEEEDDDDDSEEEYDYDEEDEDDDDRNEENVSETKVTDIKQDPKEPPSAPEPTNQARIKTKNPVSTTPSNGVKVETKPIIKKKTIEIHNELPVNKTSPHITQYKQDIKEVEIIKELPSKPHQRKTKKKPEILELYKDENLPRQVNKLGDVDIFKQNLDLSHGPKHGGNYKSAPLVDIIDDTSISTPINVANVKIPKEDTDTSQSENKKLIKSSDLTKSRNLHGGNLKSIHDISRPKSSSSSRNGKLELDENYSPTSRQMHGGNLKSKADSDKLRPNSRNQKLIEFDEELDDEDEDVGNMHGGNFKSYSSRGDGKSLHGGNYRSAELVQSEEERTEDDKRKAESKARKNAAILLNSYAQAAPILTTTPQYILDPSKRMYYYVDT